MLEEVKTSGGWSWAHAHIHTYTYILILLGCLCACLTQLGISLSQLPPQSFPFHYPSVHKQINLLSTCWRWAPPVREPFSVWWMGWGRGRDAGGHVGRAEWEIWWRHFSWEGAIEVPSSLPAAWRETAVQEKQRWSCTPFRLCNYSSGILVCKNKGYNTLLRASTLSLGLTWKTGNKDLSETKGWVAVSSLMLQYETWKPRGDQNTRNSSAIL